MNTLDLASRRVELRKASSTHGGEWQGPCPACGGTDRFHVWPEQNEGRGGYWCRGCGKTGDNIQFLRDFEGLSFRDACARLNITVPDRPDHHSPGSGSSPAHTKPEFKPETHPAPADLWQEKAEKLVAWSQENLAGNKDVLAWLAGRGIDADTAYYYRLGWNPGENGKDLYRPRKAWGLPELLRDDNRPKALLIPRGLVIPYIVGGVIHRIRIRRPEAHRTKEWSTPYHVLSGSSMATMILARDRRAFLVVESELDGIAVAAATPLVGAVALGSVSAKPDVEVSAVLRSALQILNALDYGDMGGGAKAASRAIAWWTENFRHCDRWPVPKGKDPGEAVRLGIDLARWIEAGLPPALTIGNVRGLEDGVIPPGMTRGISPLASAIENVNKALAETSRILDLAPAVLELLGLLRKNPSVKIINTPGRYTVLRDGKYVGGRINELVFRDAAVMDYIASHPAAEIDGTNLIFRMEGIA